MGCTRRSVQLTALAAVWLAPRIPVAYKEGSPSLSEGPSTPHPLRVRTPPGYRRPPWGLGKGAARFCRRRCCLLGQE